MCVVVVVFVVVVVCVDNVKSQIHEQLLIFS